MLNHSSSCDEIKKDKDYISKLPDAILTQILALLPIADANRTRILSNRWKYPWAFLPNLRFVMPICWSTEQVKKFHDSVDQTLAIRGSMHIQTFFIYCSRGCDYIRVYDCLHTVVKCQVQKLELTFPPDKYRVRFCWRLFKTCHTLVELTLKGEFLLHVPEASLLFPSLKKINLVAIDSFSGYETLENLIFGCPVLQELCLERQVSIDNYQTVKVSSSSLKRLRIIFNEAGLGYSMFMIDAPKLEYLYIEVKVSADYSFTDSLSIVEAHISTITMSVYSLVTRFLAAKILTLTSATISSLSLGIGSVHGLNMPIFPNLVKLMISLKYSYYWNLMILLLNSMPNLEHITLLDGISPFSPSWDPPVEAPACLRFKMKEIRILNRITVRQEEFISIRYLLKHSGTLETMTINALGIDTYTRDQLLNFYRGSCLCRVVFI